MEPQVKLEKKGKQELLVITLPVERRPSASGKSIVVASTNGNKETKIEIDGKPVILGVNAYIKK